MRNAPIFVGRTNVGGIQLTEQRDYYAAKYKKIEDLPGVGESTLGKLAELGYKTVESLATAHPNELIAEGLGETTAVKLVTAARKAMAIEFITAGEYDDIVFHFREHELGVDPATEGETIVPILLTGQLHDGTALAGSDVVRITPNNSPQSKFPCPGTRC